ncbi:hypothetical protein NQ317_013601 [Molorchus minor]|uniref:Uncharacterized protein n=1 Tax=Molorchus minor TaxID=1323400 RepID=A0ABQ9ISJ9_9CUCU|nr:hypothetical protein NQ317_013601 [Molorchus minor]
MTKQNTYMVFHCIALGQGKSGYDLFTYATLNSQYAATVLIFSIKDSAKAILKRFLGDLFVKISEWATSIFFKSNHDNGDKK